MECWDVTKYKGDKEKLKKKAKKHLNKNEEVEIGEPEEIGSVPLFFDSDDHLLGLIVDNESGGGMIAQGTTWISSGKKGTIIMWPLTDGFVANTTIRRVKTTN